MNKPMHILITDTAKLDIINISKYIAKDNTNAAINIIDSFKRTFKMLEFYPKTGVYKIGIKDKTIRIYTIKKKYSIVYRIKDNNLEILRILTRYQDIFTILF